MNIKAFKKTTPAMDRFARREWRSADREHYGRIFPQPWSRTYYLIAEEREGGIRGRLTLNLKAGVAEISELIIAKKHQGEGVGSALLVRAERIARKHKAHKLILDTGKGWSAEKFYRKYGFTLVTVLRKHYRKRDFILLEKRL